MTLLKFDTATCNIVNGATVDAAGTYVSSTIAHAVLTTDGIISGKTYMECYSSATSLALGFAHNSLDFTTMGVGIINTSLTLPNLTASLFVGDDPDGFYKGDSVNAPTGFNSLPSDIIMLAIDTDVGDVWVGINGTWVTDPLTQSPSLTGLTVGGYRPFVNLFAAGNATFVFDLDALTYTPPKGYVAVNNITVDDDDKMLLPPNIDSEKALTNGLSISAIVRGNTLTTTNNTRHVLNGATFNSHKNVDFISLGATNRLEWNNVNLVGKDFTCFAKIRLHHTNDVGQSNFKKFIVGQYDGTGLSNDYDWGFYVDVNNDILFYHRAGFNSPILLKLNYKYGDWLNLQVSKQGNNWLVRINDNSAILGVNTTAMSALTDFSVLGNWTESGIASGDLSQVNLWVNRAFTESEFDKLIIDPQKALYKYTSSATNFISGTVIDINGTPAIRRILLFVQLTGIFYKSTTSNEMGKFTISATPNTEFIVVCEDVGDNPENALVFDRVLPEPLV